MASHKYSDADFMSYGNVPQPRSCGGCGAPSPCDGFIGAYVPPKYLARPCQATTCAGYPNFVSGYPEGPGSNVQKKAPYPMNPATYSQECSNCSRGVDSRQLFEGNDCASGCDGFDDVYVDFCRDVAYADTLHSDYTNVLSTTWNQTYDVRGPVDCGSDCGGCPTHQFRGLYGYSNCLDPALAPTGSGMATRGNHCSQGNAMYRTFNY